MAGEWTAARGGGWWEAEGLHLIEQTLLRED